MLPYAIQPSRIENVVAEELKMSHRKAAHWAKALPEYQRILNEEPKDVLKCKSPFEVYFARKPSYHTSQAVESEDLVSKESVTNAAICNPTIKDRERRCRRAQDVTPKSGSCSDCTLPSKNGG